MGGTRQRPTRSPEALAGDARAKLDELGQTRILDEMQQEERVETKLRHRSVMNRTGRWERAPGHLAGGDCGSAAGASDFVMALAMSVRRIQLDDVVEEGKRSEHSINRVGDLMVS